MAKKRSFLQGLFGGKCPRCRQGEMFTHPWYRVDKMFSMHKHCSHCEFTYEREPGYFYGAMYVSYAMVVALFIVIGFTLYQGFGIDDINVFLLVIPLAAFTFLPLIIRYSRIIFLHVFGGVKYEPEKNSSE